MTNSFRNIAIALFSVLFVLLAGCKKDEVASSFILDTESMDFEYGQTKGVGFSAKEAGSFRVVDVPDGWACTYSDGKFRITSPSESDSSAELEGDINVMATSSNGTAMERTIEVAIRIAEEIIVPANSYVVSTPDKRFKFNARRRGNETTETLAGLYDAVLLWTGADFAVRNVSLENDYVYFSTGNFSSLVEGNAVIAVRDKKKKVLWSWHIWAVSDDPTLSTVVLNGKEVMNRNLGALAGSNSTERNVLRSFGLYYQWGRKDPFVGPDAWNSSIQQTLLDAKLDAREYNFVASDKDTGTLEYAIAHPDTFIAGAEESNYHWLFDLDLANSKDGDRGLWGGSSSSATIGPKTVYDPCPAGWRVASREVFETFPIEVNAGHNPEDYNIVGEYNYGWTFSVDGQEIFMPAAGRRSFSPTLASTSRNYTNIVNDGDGNGSPVGFYWYSDDVNSFAFRRDYISFFTLEVHTPIDQIARAGAFPLRCMAE